MNGQLTVPFVLKVVALAMGVAVVVLSILGTAGGETLSTLLGIGLFCLAFWAMQSGK